MDTATGASHADFLSVLDRALKDKEIVRGVAKTGLSLEELRQLALDAEDSIWETLAKERLALDVANEALDAAQRELFVFRAIPVARLHPRLLWGVVIVLFTLLVLWVITTLRHVHVVSATFYLTAGASLGLVFGVIILGVALYNRFHVLPANAEIERAKQEAATALEMPRLRQNVRTRQALLHENLLKQDLIPHLRQIINAHLPNLYAKALPLINAPGLSEVYDPEYEVSTSARARLQGLLESMPGGSIGVAGPRGAGKSTLLASICGGRITKLAGREVVSLLVSAPVKYDARDFVLYLFSAFLKSLLGGEPQNPPEPESRTSRRYKLSAVRAVMAPVAYLSRVTWLTILWLVLVIELVRHLAQPYRWMHLVARNFDHTGYSVSGSLKIACAFCILDGLSHYVWRLLPDVDDDWTLFGPRPRRGFGPFGRRLPILALLLGMATMASAILIAVALVAIPNHYTLHRWP
jgi:hypothetical protein